MIRAAKVVGVGVASAVLGCSSPEQDALAVCERAVRSRLVAPSTAVFASYFDAEIDKVQAEIDKVQYAYVVRSSVESQNALAVPLRQEFLCRVEGKTVTQGPFLALPLATLSNCTVAKFMEEKLTSDEARRIELRRENRDKMPECGLYDRAGLIDSL